MRALHRPEMFSWSAFDAARNVDFNGYALVHPDGNILIDPMPMSPHDILHLEGLGGAAKIVISNSDHVRAATALATRFGAQIFGPAAEREDFPIACHQWLCDGDDVVSELEVITLDGSKTPGELALLFRGTTLITGDLVRAHTAGSLMMLPDAKLTDPQAARASVRRLASIPDIEAVLVGDGWPVFRDGAARLADLAASIDRP